jgi:hypothetical protein
MKEKTKQYKPYKSKIKIIKDSNLGMYRLEGESLTRTNVNNVCFYDKSEALRFKLNIDNFDYDFYRDNFDLFYKDK